MPECYTAMTWKYPNIGFQAVPMGVFGVGCFSIRGLQMKGKRIRRGSVIAFRRDGNLSV